MLGKIIPLIMRFLFILAIAVAIIGSLALYLRNEVLMVVSIVLSILIIVILVGLLITSQLRARKS